MSQQENPIFRHFRTQIDGSSLNPSSEEVIGEYQQKILRAVIDPSTVYGMGSYRLMDETGPIRMTPYAAYAFFPENGDYAKMVMGLNRTGIPTQELDEQTICMRMMAAQIPERMTRGEIPVATDDEDALRQFEDVCAVEGNPSLMMALCWNPDYRTIPLLYTLVGMSPQTGLSVVQYAAGQTLEKFK